MKTISVIVPTYNMGQFLTPLFESIVNSDLAPRVQEIIFANDRSTDATLQVVARLAERQRGRTPTVRLVEPDKNSGRFVMRHLGASAAATNTLLFIDSRITLPPATTRALPELVQHHPALVAHVDVDDRKNIYCLYWRRSHARFYRAEDLKREAVTITAANFAEAPFGSTCFICPRDAYLRVSAPHLGQPMWSDDTLLFADLVKTTPVVLAPGFRIDWEPRDRLVPFLGRLFDRGPGLAQYHFFRKRGALFYATAFATVFLIFCLALALVHPLWSLGLLGGAVLLAALSTALIAESVGEFFKLAPLHVAVIAAYGFGGWRGAWVVWRGRSPRRE